MKETEKMKETKLDLLLVIVIWGTVGLILLLRVAKNIATGEAPNAFIVAGAILCLATVVGTILGGALRHAVLRMWMLVAALGFLTWIVSIGFDLGIGKIASGMWISGFLSAGLIYMLDRR